MAAAACAAPVAQTAPRSDGNDPFQGRYIVIEIEQKDKKSNTSSTQLRLTDAEDSDNSAAKKEPAVPPLRYCVNINDPIDRADLHYNCRFFELITLDGKEKMPSRIWDPPDDDEKGFRAQCKFAYTKNDGEVRFYCGYSVKGEKRPYPCTTFAEELSLEEFPNTVPLVSISNGEVQPLSYDKKSKAGKDFPVVTGGETGLQSEQLDHENKLMGCAALFGPDKKAGREILKENQKSKSD